MKPPLPTAAEKRLAKRMADALFTREGEHLPVTRIELVLCRKQHPTSVLGLFGLRDVQDLFANILAASRKRRPRAGKGKG